MKKITSDYLAGLIAHVDYIYPDSYPICFKDSHGNQYEIGIEDSWQELQYFIDVSHPSLLEIMDPDIMSYGDCESWANYFKGEDIYLYEKSFSGKQRTIFTWS